MLRTSACNFGVGDSLDFDAEVPITMAGLERRWLVIVACTPKNFAWYWDQVMVMSVICERKGVSRPPSSSTWPEDKSCASSWYGGSLFETNIVIEY